MYVYVCMYIRMYVCMCACVRVCVTDYYKGLLLARVRVLLCTAHEDIEHTCVSIHS